MTIPSKWRGTIYIAAILAVVVSIAVGVLAALGVVSAEQVKTGIAVAALVLSGLGNLLARLNVTPDQVE